jgi:hypothetical protein
MTAHSYVMILGTFFLITAVTLLAAVSIGRDAGSASVTASIGIAYGAIAQIGMRWVRRRAAAAGFVDSESEESGSAWHGPIEAIFWFTAAIFAYWGAVSQGNYVLAFLAGSFFSSGGRALLARRGDGISAIYPLIPFVAVLFGLAFAGLYLVPWIASATQSIHLVQAFGFTTGLMLGLLGERMRRRTGKSSLEDKGYFFDAVKSYPIVHFVLGVSATAALGIYHFSIQIPGDYDRAFTSNLLLGLLTSYLLLAVINFRNEKSDE